MRILMLAQFYPPIIGGEERHVRNLSQELAARGHHVAVATLWQPGLPMTELDGEVCIYRVPSTTQRATWLFTESERPHAPPLPDPETVWGLHHVLESEQPDVVHAHNWLLHSFLPLKLRHPVPLVVTLHDYSLACAKKRLMYRGLPCSGPGWDKCFTCAADHYGTAKGALTVVANWSMGMAERELVDMFLTVSAATASGNGLPESDLPHRVVHTFIPDDIDTKGDPTDPRLSQLPQGDYLLFAGDLSHDKGVDVLLKAYAGLSNPPPLVLIGRPCPDTPCDIPANVLVFNKWPYGAVMESWRRSLFALAPSTWVEPCGTVVLEAMAMGRAVIASRTGGLPDLVVHEETGLLVTPNDPLSLQHAMQRLLDDPHLRERMGQAGKERVLEFCAGTVVPRIESVYEEVIRHYRNFSTPVASLASRFRP